MKRALLLPLALGCAADLTPEPTQRLRLAFEPLYLTQLGARRFDVKVSQGPYSDRMAPVFGATCAPYGTDAPSIGPLTPANDLVIQVTFYKDDLCKEPILVGARGGVRIAEGTSVGSWFVPVFPVGGFGAFPALSQSVADAARKASCTTDADCRIANPDGSYQLSAIAQCDEKAKKCFVPPTVYPLDMGSPRAFHTATALSDGRVALVGGVATSDGAGGWIGTAENVEVFHPDTLTFEFVEVPDLAQQRMALHSAVRNSDDSLSIFGGAVQLQLALNDVTGGKALSLTVPAGNGLGTDNLLQLAIRLDLDSRSAKVGALPLPLAGASAAVVGRNVLLTGGFTAKGSVVSRTDSALTCALGSGSPDCESAGQLGNPRAGHCTVCTDSKCASVALVGGSELGGAASAGELYDGKTFSPLAAAGDLTTGVDLATCAGGVLVGGRTNSASPANLAPQTLTTGSGKLTGAEVEDLGTVTDPFRVSSAAAVLDDGRILVTGGLNERGEALNTAYLIKDGKVTASFTMAKARFGHTATLLTSGPMAGSVLVAGGLTTTADGTLAVAAGAELFHP